MEKFALQVILQNGLWKAAIATWLIMFISAWAAVRLTNFHWRLDRPAYFLSCGFVLFLISATMLPAFDINHAIAAGYLWLVVGAVYGLLIPIGAFAGICAAARSLDAYDSKNKWYLAFIPIANLFFMWDKSTTPPKSDHDASPAIFAMLVGGIALAAGGKFGLEPLIKQAMLRSEAAAPITDLGLAATGVKHHVDTVGLTKALQYIASSVEVSQFSDANIQLIDVKANIDTLAYSYKILDQTIADNMNAFKAKMLMKACEPENAQLLDLGATLTSSFHSPTGGYLGEITVSPGSCTLAGLTFEKAMIPYAKAEKGFTVQDGYLTLSEVRYVDNTFIYDYRIATVLPRGWQEDITRFWCKSPNSKEILNIGMPLRGIFRSATDEVLGDLTIDLNACTALANASM